MAMPMNATSGYAQAVSMQNAVTAPKEIGVLQRVDGLLVGLSELKGRLQAFDARLAGNGLDASSASQTLPVGLLSTLSDAEGTLRDCLAMVGSLNDRF